MDSRYINRELSWLKFNERVLEEASDQKTPLFERLRFVSIFTSNLDEFYMVRVGSLQDQTLLGKEAVDNKTGMTAAEQIIAVNTAVRALYPEKDRAYFDIMAAFSQGGAPYHTSIKDLDGGYKRIVKDYFEREIAPILSPQIIDAKHPFPHLENKMTYVAVSLKSKTGSLYGIIPRPAGTDRLFFVPGINAFLLLEDIILRYADLLFGIYKVESKTVFRVTRSADIEVSEGLLDEDTDFRSLMSEIIKKRSRLGPVRFETNDASDGELIGFFLSKLGLDQSQCFVCASPLEMGFVSKLEDSLEPKLHEKLVYTPARPQWPADLEHGHIIEQVLERDLLLSYPYESMRPFIDLVREAAEDKNVLSIKITLYRIGLQSQIVQSLCAAAENGKDVTVMIELRARFDEQNNINWSNLMEEAGCHIIYGVEEFKVHSKIMLITRRAERHLQYITHIGTGNYNESTARIYADLNLLTADKSIGEDAVEFFQNLTIANTAGVYHRLLVSPTGLKKGIIDLIRREAQKAKEGRSARIIAKMNSLTDKDVIDEMITASQAGVKISLIIRGICCLRPGVPGQTENIECRSIVGRFLEHARIYCFGDGEEMKLYISSADMMTRNTTRRVEIAAPILNKRLAADIRAMLEVMLKDNVKARTVGPDGIYHAVEPGGRPAEEIDSQMYFYDLAVKRTNLRAEGEAKAYRMNQPGLFGRVFGLFKKR
jgi:polyphosphate kinase 1